MPIETIDTTKLAQQADNLYEAVVIVSKRARQIGTRVKAELDQKLSYFEEVALEPTDELRTNEDQLRISLEYERKPKATGTALNEMLNDELYFRNPTADETAANEAGI